VAVQRQTSFTNLRFRFISHTVVLFFECIRSIIFFAAVVTRCQLDVQIIQLQGVQRLNSHSVTVLLYGTDLTVAVCTGVVQTAGVFLALRQSRVNDLDPPRLFTVAGIFRTVYRNRNQFNAGILCTGGLVFFVNQSGIAVLELELCILIASQLLGYAGRQFYNYREFLGIRCALDSTLGIRFLKAPPVAVCLGVRCTKVVGEICDHLIRLQIKLQGGDAVAANIRRRLALGICKRSILISCSLAQICALVCVQRIVLVLRIRNGGFQCLSDRYSTSCCFNKKAAGSNCNRTCHHKCTDKQCTDSFANDLAHIYRSFFF